MQIDRKSLLASLLKKRNSMIISFSGPHLSLNSIVPHRTYHGYKSSNGLKWGTFSQHRKFCMVPAPHTMLRIVFGAVDHKRLLIKGEWRSRTITSCSLSLILYLDPRCVFWKKLKSE